MYETEEYSIPNCNGLGVTLECSRSESLPSREAFKRGFPISELKLKRVVARYNFTITLYNQTAAAMRITVLFLKILFLKN